MNADKNDSQLEASVLYIKTFQILSRNDKLLTIFLIAFLVMFHHKFAAELDLVIQCNPILTLLTKYC